MGYQEKQAESNRVVVETPNSRREVSHSESVRYPERNGVSSGALAAIVVGVVVLAAIVILFVVNRQQANDNANVAQQPPQTTIVQQPAQQPPPQQAPIVVQQPATQPAPVIINGQSAPTTSGGSSTSPDDGTIQAAIDKRLNDDPTYATLGITTTVVSGKVTLAGTVKTAALRSQVERAVRDLKGVKSVDNQIIVG